MRKRFYTLMLAGIVVALGAYLYIANAYIYWRIGKAALPFLQIEKSYTMKNLSAGTERIYVSLGDSLTSGVGTDTYTKSYPYLLAQKLAAKGTVKLENFSYPGVRSQNLIADFIPQVIASKPSIVTVLIGTNDIHDWVSAGQFEENYRHILRALTASTTAKVYAVSIPYIGSNTLFLPPYNYYFDYETTEFNDIIRHVAAEYKVAYVDIATPTRALFKYDGQMYSADSFHPSAEGYKLWSDILYASIDK